MLDNVVSPIEVEAEIKQYTLVGDDIYIKRYTNENIPDWYRQLVSDIIAQDNTITDMDAAIDYLSSLPSGYNQMITELQNTDELINTSLESLVATTGSHTAAIANLQATKVDESSAAAIARTTIGAYFAEGSAGAWFNSEISTYASSIAANALSVSTLSATVAGQTVMIEDISSVDIDPVTGYMLGASKLGTAPDGSITGWQFADGTNVQSTFKIKATNFSVSDGTTGYTPFSITGSNVSFNGVVDFTNTNAYGTTTIDGGKITTGTITASQLTADSINGFIIEGNYIKGAYIEGSVIKSSWIDYTTTGDLTDWQALTPATVPSGYVANFAHNNDGSLVVDSLGYVRLVGHHSLYTNNVSSAAPVSIVDGAGSYNYYESSSPKRMVSLAVVINNPAFTLLDCFSTNRVHCYFYFTIVSDNFYIHSFNPDDYDYLTIEVYKNGSLVTSGTDLSGNNSNFLTFTSALWTHKISTYGGTSQVDQFYVSVESAVNKAYTFSSYYHAPSIIRDVSNTNGSLAVSAISINIQST